MIAVFLLTPKRFPLQHLGCQCALKYNVSTSTEGEIIRIRAKEGQERVEG